MIESNNLYKVLITENMKEDQVRKRFSRLLKEMHRKYGAEMSSTEFYNNLQNLRQESVSKIANNKQAIKDLMIIELLALDPDISVDWLFTGEGEMFRSKNATSIAAQELASYHERVKILEAKVDKMEALLEETLKLTRLDLVNRGLLQQKKAQK